MSMDIMNENEMNVEKVSECQKGYSMAIQRFSCHAYVHTYINMRVCSIFHECLNEYLKEIATLIIEYGTKRTKPPTMCPNE